MSEVFNQEFIERELRRFHNGQPRLAIREPYERKIMPEFMEVLNAMDRDDRFRATVYAMNTLLIHKKVYSPAEFEERFLEYAAKESR